MTGPKPDWSKLRRSADPKADSARVHKKRFEATQDSIVNKRRDDLLDGLKESKDKPMLGKGAVEGIIHIRRDREMANLKPMGHAERMFADTVPDKPIIPKAKENADKRKAAAAERDERGKEAYEWVVDENEKRDAKRLAKYGKIAVRGGN